MRWTQQQPAELIDVQSIKDHLRIDGTSEDTYLAAITAAAVAHAEQIMQCSLLTRTITAVFYSGETLNLPRGPVQSVTSVSVSGTPVSESAYSLERYGTSDLLRFQNGNIQPLAAPAVLTVIYSAGYADHPEDVPADIVHVIKAHVGLLYEQRELATDRTITPVPFIDDYYKLRSREPGVG